VIFIGILKDLKNSVYMFDDITLTFTSSEYLREKFDWLEENIVDVIVVDVADEHLDIVSSSSESYCNGYTKLLLCFWSCCC